MSKGDWRRPSCIPDSELEKRWADVFGEKKLNCMSPTEREQMIQEKERLAREATIDDNNTG